MLLDRPAEGGKAVNQYLTREAFERLSEELKKLKERKQDLSHQIGVAAAHGDLRENAEYDAAKEEQQKTLHRIGELEGILQTAQFLDNVPIPDNRVFIGAAVMISTNGTKHAVTYTLTAPADADFSQGRISVESPLAKGLLGHAVGEAVTVQLPTGPITYKILKISRGKKS